MRANYAGLAIFAGLASVVAGDGLPPDAIPIQCATICGPIVELTSMCDVHDRLRRRRSLEQQQERRLESREWVPKLAVEPKVPREWVPKLAVEPKVPRAAARLLPPPIVGQTPHRPNSCSENLARRNTTVVRPAPTAFQPQQIATLDLRPTATVSRLIPIIVENPPGRRTTTTTTTVSLPVVQPSTLRPPPPTTSDLAPDPDLEDGDGPALPTQPTRPPVLAPPPVVAPPLQSSAKSNPATTTVTLGDASNTLSAPPMEASGGKEQKGTHNGTPATPMVDDQAEEQCVCLNTSFDVAMVAALCSSCIDSTGDPLNNAKVIVDTCNFPPQTYTQARDSIVNNIRVKAVRPGNAWDKGSSVDNSPASDLSPARRVAVSVAVGVFSLLLGSAILL